MSNRRRTTLERAEKKAVRRRCPKCGTTNVKTKDYSDAKLHVCQNPACGFPVREVKKRG